MQTSQHEESALFDAVDGRATLAGSNRMEILLFSLGTGEHFGINVFKVREVSKTPFITRTPNMPAGVEGLISLRGDADEMRFSGLETLENRGRIDLANGLAGDHFAHVVE